jgi:hypothetical protein
MKEAKISFHTHEGHYNLLVMPFVLFNAYSTFHSLKSNIFNPFLCICVLLFFDRILVYNKTWVALATHV